MTVETPWSGIQLSAADWAEAFDAAEPGTPHNEAREAIWAELLTIAIENHEGDAPADQLRRSLQQNRELRAALNRAWPLIEAADDEYGMGLVTMLRGEDFQDALVNEATLSDADPNLLAGPFSHIVVDEAQELTDAEWQMLLLRCPSRSFTIVGDRAQARHGFTESWRERLERVGLDQISLASLSINYRTPEEVMAEAEPVIRAVLPDANVPVSIRSSGIPVGYGATAELVPILDAWLAAHDDGIACVIGAATV